MKAAVMTTLHPVDGNEPINYDWEKAWEKPEPAAPNLSIRPVMVSGASAYGKKALAEELRILANTPEGSRNHQLFKSAAALAELVAASHLSDQATRQELYRTAIAIGLTPTETAGTIRSAFAAGLQQPRQVTPLEQPGVNITEVPETTIMGDKPNPAEPDNTAQTRFDQLLLQTLDRDQLRNIKPSEPLIEKSAVILQMLLS